METAKIYVRQDEHGVLRVVETRVMLDSVVAAFNQGHSAETIASSTLRFHWKRFTARLRTIWPTRRT